jgi:hypothetical protein
MVTEKSFDSKVISGKRVSHSATVVKENAETE